MGWWVGGMLGWWVGGLMGWWDGGLVGWWVREFVDSFVRSFVRSLVGRSIRPRIDLQRVSAVGPPVPAAQRRARSSAAREVHTSIAP